MKRPNRVALRGHPCRNPMEGVLAAPSDSVDPHGEQAPIIQGLYGAQHGALHPQLTKEIPKQLPLYLVICRFEVHKAEIQWRLEASVLVNDVLQHKCLMDGAVPWPVACLSGRSEASLLCGG